MHADRLDHEVAQLDSLVGGRQQVDVWRVERQQDVQVAIGFRANGSHRSCDADTRGLYAQPIRVVDVLILVGRLAARGWRWSRLNRG